MGVREFVKERVEERVTKDRIVNERILNVIRRSEAGFVGTTEVVNDDHVDLKYDAVKSHLEDLEKGGRIHSKMIGHSSRGNLAWYLDDDEYQDPVNAENYWASNWVTHAREISGNILRVGGISMLTGMMLVMISLTTGMYGLQVEVLQPSTAGAAGYALAVAGVANVMLGGGLKWGFVLTGRKILGNSKPPGSQSDSDSASISRT